MHGAKVRRIRIDQVEVPESVRRPSDAESQARLIESIDAVGHLEIIQVRPLRSGRYELIHGYRRLRAERERGGSHITAVIEPASRIESLLMLLASEESREPRSLLDRAWLMDELRQLLAGSGSPHQQKDLCRLTGAAKGTVSEHLELAELFPRTRIESEVNQSHADLAAVRAAPRSMLRKAREIDGEDLRVRELVSRATEGTSTVAAPANSVVVRETTSSPATGPSSAKVKSSPGEPARVRPANWRSYLRERVARLLRRLIMFGTALERRISPSPEEI